MLLRLASGRRGRKEKSANSAEGLWPNFSLYLEQNHENDHHIKFEAAASRPLHTPYRPRRALRHDHKRTFVVGQRPLRGERPQHRRLGWRISRIASAGSLVGICFCRVDL
jgi:hypothetical protein